MGGGLVVLQQARWGSYDAIGVLGYTHGAKARAVPSGDDAARRATAVEQAKGFWGDQWEARYGVVDKAPHQNWLNGPDAPADIVAADNANAVIWAAEPYVDALHVGYTAAYAARVTAPVMVAFGEFDIAERPRDEAAFYERSDDITLFVLAGSYHCHNFQDGRARLWDRLGAWATEVVTASGRCHIVLMRRHTASRASRSVNVSSRPGGRARPVSSVAERCRVHSVSLPAMGRTNRRVAGALRQGRRPGVLVRWQGTAT